MSIKDRLSKKMEGLVVPNKGEVSGGSGTLRTGPGQMLMVNSLMKESNQKLAQLEARLKEFEGVLPVRLIDADKIVPSKWANRNALGFDSTDFQKLKEEIAGAEGNVQPIKVRPVAGQVERYEIVFGHRRHQACLELGIPVLALVEEVSDVDMFKEMDRENRTRLDLSPWEQGMMYRRALDEKLFPSQEQLARELGVDAGNLSKALKLASLDKRIVDAFPSPLALQFRWSKPLIEALKADEAAVLSKAEELAKEGRLGRTPKEVFEALVGSSSERKGSTSVLPIMVDEMAIATITRNKDEVAIRFAKGIMNDKKLDELYEILSEWLRG